MDDERHGQIGRRPTPLMERWREECLRALVQTDPAGRDDRLVAYVIGAYFQAVHDGLAIAEPNRGVISLTGDGSLLMNLGCMVTIAQHPANMWLILLDNAVKFTARGGRVRVRVGLANDRPMLLVEDTGVGIAPEQLPHVFERFYRGDPSRSRGDGGVDGAGLGLSIAKWIADTHGAHIDLESMPGQGARFTVTFPPVPSAA